MSRLAFHHTDVSSSIALCYCATVPEGFGRRAHARLTTSQSTILTAKKRRCKRYPATCDVHLVSSELAFDQPNGFLQCSFLPSQSLHFYRFGSAYFMALSTPPSLRFLLSSSANDAGPHGRPVSPSSVWAQASYSGSFSHPSATKYTIASQRNSLTAKRAQKCACCRGCSEVFSFQLGSFGSHGMQERFFQ